MSGETFSGHISGQYPKNRKILKDKEQCTILDYLEKQRIKMEERRREV